MSTYTIIGDSIYLFFDNKPNKDIRDYLILNKWKWNPIRKAWMHKQEITTEAVAEMAIFLYDISINKPDMIHQIVNEQKQSIKPEQIDLSYDNDVHIVKNMDDHQFHKTVNYSGNITICYKSGNKDKQIVPIVYCKNCNKYYILQADYDSLYSKTKVPLVRFISDKKGFDSLREESPLKLFGYNVSQKENLSSKERHNILKMIYKKGIMPKRIIVSYLYSFINSHTNEIFITARERWQSDIDYVNKNFST